MGAWSPERYRAIAAIVVLSLGALCAATPITVGSEPWQDRLATPSPSPSPRYARRDLQTIIDVSDNFLPGARAVPGPAVVEYLAINPLIYPYWTMKVDNVVKDGPALTLGTNAQTPLNAIDSGLSSPQPGTVPTGSPFVRVFAPRQIAMNVTYPSCVAKTLDEGTAANQLIDFNDCYQTVEKAFQDLRTLIESNQAHLTKTGSNYNALVTRVSRILTSPSARCGEVRNPDDPDSPDLCNGRRPKLDDELSNLDANIARSVIGRSLRGRYDGDDPISAHGIIQHAGKIPAWPSDQVQLLSVAATNLRDAFDNFPSPSPSPKATATTASALKKTTPKKTSTPKRPDSAATRTRNAANAKAKAKADAIAAALADERQPCFDGSTQSRKSTICIRRVRRILAQLDSWAKGGPEQIAFDDSRQQLLDYSNQRLAYLSLSRFHFRDREGCRGVNGSRRDRTYTLQLDATQISSITVVCESRLFLSAGIGFSSLSQGTYMAIPDTHASPSPTTLPTGAGIIQYVATSDIRPVPITLVNYRLFDVGQYGEQAIYSSFGVGIASSAQNQILDYVGGFSYGTSKGALITLGAHIGQQSVLQPGYNVGDVVTGQAPVTTRNRLGWIIVISYGKQ